MPKSYCHLTYEERCQIEALKKSGLSVVLIVEQLGRHRATIYREINRNSGKRGYRHKQVQEKAKTRRRAASSVPWRFTPVLWAEVVKELEDGLSPEQISGRFQLERRPVGRQQIYNFVHADRRAGGDLWTKLRRRGKKPNKKGKSHAGRGHIPGRVDISERPAIVEEKVRVGDWEVDPVVGKEHSGAVVSLADRATKYAFLGRVGKKNERGGVLYLDPTARFRRDPGPHNHRRQQQGVRRPQSCGESPRGTILLRQTLSFLATRIERAHQRLGAGILSKGNGLSQGI